MPTGLPVLADAKAYLKSVDSGVEDTLIQQLLDRAFGACQSYLSRPINSTQQTFTLMGRTRGPASVLDVGASPIDTTQPITVVDGFGLTIPTTNIFADAALGLLYRVASLATPAVRLPWCAFPYTVTLSWGLSARVDWTDVVAPAVGAAILDATADLFQRRNPAASRESAGGGVSSDYGRGATELPPRICAVLDRFRMVTG